MSHRIVSVYFPDGKVIQQIEAGLSNNSSVSSFIVDAVIEKLNKAKGSANDIKVIQKDGHE